MRFKLVRDVVNLLAFEDYIISSELLTMETKIDALTRNGLATFSHPVATCVMSPRGASHGADPDLGLKEAGGIHVVDASILVNA